MPQQNVQKSQRFCTDLIEIRYDLLRYSKRLCGDRDLAEDLVQETLLRAIDKQNSFKTGTSLRAWTFTILRNLCFANWHKQKKLAPWGSWLNDLLVISGGQEDAATLAQLAARMYGLPEAQRSALALVAVGGCSYEEAADIAQCAVGTMKSRVSRARAALVETTGGGKLPPGQAGFDVIISLCSNLLAHSSPELAGTLEVSVSASPKRHKIRSVDSSRLMHGRAKRDVQASESRL